MGVRAIIAAYWFAIVFFVVLVVTQVVLPLIASRPLFPLLRTQRRELESELDRVHEAHDLADVREQLDHEVNKLKSRRKKQ